MKVRLAALSATGLVLACAPAAHAQGMPVPSEYGFALTSQVPSSPTGLSVRILFRHPRDPQAKPPVVQELGVRLPAGLRLDTGTVPVCSATDDQIRAMGRRACPPASRLGAGFIRAATGLSPLDPVELDLTSFNGGNQIVDIVTFKGTDIAAAIDRLTIEGDRVVAHPPSPPGGPPDGRTTLREALIQIEPVTAGGRSFVTTPAECPEDGAWTSALSLAFTGYDPLELIGRTPCVRAAEAAGMRLVVRPRSLRAGERVRFRFSVSSDSADCRGGVTVRLGRRSARTDGRGRAAIVTSLRRRGRATARAAKRGCAPARASVRVR